jgi:hypothetical protein
MPASIVALSGFRRRSDDLQFDLHDPTSVRPRLGDHVGRLAHVEPRLVRRSPSAIDQDSAAYVDESTHVNPR